MSFFGNHKGYPEVPIIEVATLKRGYDLPIQNRMDGDIPIYAANGQNGTHNKAKILGPGVVTGRSGTIGKVHYVDGNYWPLNTALYVTDFHGNHPKWVYYMLQAFKLDRFVEGAGVPTLNRNLFHNEEIPLPPLPEQKRIAAILDKVDCLRRKNKQVIQLADQFLRAVFLDMFGDPVTNPKGWEKNSLENVCLQVIDCPHSTPKWTNSGVIGLRTSNLTKGSWNWDDKRFVSEETYNERIKRAELKENDIILSREGTIGVAALVPPNVPMCMGQRLVQLRVNTDILCPEYMLFLLLYELEPERISKVMAGSTSQHLNVKDLRELSIAIPPIKKQHDFSQIFTWIKNGERKNNLAGVYAQELFNSLSQKAFAGEL